MAILKRILYLEDEADILTVTKISLENIGSFTLQTCTSGEEAIAKASAFMPDLLLLDVMLPDMDGPSTLKILRTLPGLTNTPVIFMTAKVQAEEINQLKALGALDIITKPFDPMSLAEQINNVWERHQLK